MQYIATFSFKDNLTDFVPGEATHPYYFNGTPSVKDAIEAIGIPHTEVDVILVNDVPVNFHYLLQNHDHVTVYPYQSAVSDQYSKNGIAPVENGFIADVHLGSLTRTLRMLGLDVLYNNQYTEAEIVHKADTESRIVLTRSRHLLKHTEVTWGCWIRSQNTEVQVQQVIARFMLQDVIKPFTRCIACNGCLTQVSKQVILEKLLPKTQKHFSDFWQCANCHRVYWKGSHYERMQALIAQIQASV